MDETFLETVQRPFKPAKKVPGNDFLLYFYKNN